MFTADFSDAVLKEISKHIGQERRRLATLLGLQPPQIDQIEQDNAGDSKKINLAILQVFAFLLRHFVARLLYLSGALLMVRIARKDTVCVSRSGDQLA